MAIRFPILEQRQVEPEWSLSLDDGTYEITFYTDGKALAKRHGEPWRDVTGDALVAALAREARWWRQRIMDPYERELLGLTIPKGALPR